MRGGSTPRVRPLVEAIVITAGAAGADSRAIATAMPGSNLMSIQNMLRKMVDAGTLFEAADSNRKRYFVSKEWADAFAAIERERRREAHRAQARAYWAAKYVPKPRAPRPSKPKQPSLHPKASEWSPKEIQTLRKMYPVTMDRAALAAAVGRSEHACKVMAHRLKIKKLGRKAIARIAETRPRIGPAVKRVVQTAPEPVRLHRGPAYLPGDVASLPRSPGFRHVVCPRKPDPIRTNTFSQF